MPASVTVEGGVKISFTTFATTVGGGLASQNTPFNCEDGKVFVGSLVISVEDLSERQRLSQTIYFFHHI